MVGGDLPCSSPPQPSPCHDQHQPHHNPHHQHAPRPTEAYPQSTHPDHPSPPSPLWPFKPNGTTQKPPPHRKQTIQLAVFFWQRNELSDIAYLSLLTKCFLTDSLPRTNAFTFRRSRRFWGDDPESAQWPKNKVSLCEGSLDKSMTPVGGFRSHPQTLLSQMSASPLPPPPSPATAPLPLPSKMP